jgi:hypothetical protein
MVVKLKLMLFLSLISMCYAAQTDPWQAYDLGNKKYPAIPEPSTYAQVGSVIGVGVLIAYRRKKNKSS